MSNEHLERDYCVQGESKTEDTSLSPSAVRDARLAVRKQQAIDKRRQVAKTREERETQKRLEKEKQTRRDIEEERERQRLKQEELQRFKCVLY